MQYHIFWVCAKSRFSFIWLMDHIAVSVILLAILGAKHFADMCDTMLGSCFYCFFAERLMVRFSCSAETRQLVEVTPAKVMPGTRLFSMFSFVPLGSTWETK